jgi:hypothetical protein
MSAAPRPLQNLFGTASESGHHIVDSLLFICSGTAARRGIDGEDWGHSVRIATQPVMSALVDIRLLISVCLNQLKLVHYLAPGLDSAELLDRTAAAISCLMPRLPDAVLEMEINEAAQQLKHSLT